MELWSEDSGKLPTIEQIEHALSVLFEVGCGQLPEDWELRVCMSKDEAYFDLTLAGEDVEIDDSDLNAAQMFAKRINHARTADGLENAFDDDCNLMPDLP